MLINNKNLAKSLVVLFIFTLFFPIRHVFLTNEAYFTGTYSDFTSFSLYLSDIIIFALAVIVFLPRGGGFYHVVGTLKWLILWIILGFIVHFSLNTRFSAYFLIKWVELIVAYGTFVVLFKENPLKQLFLKLFVYFCALQSIIAIIQFAGQSPLGLFKLGESHIGPNMVGVAKIVSSGTNFIRSYGTFPHPNPFSAFLVVGILIGTYLLINSPSIKARLLHSSLIFLNILGLTLTFSRGAYLALALGLLIFFGFMFFKHLKTSFTPALVLLVSVVISFFIFKPFILTRATFSDKSTVDRKFYDDVGVKMAEKNPILGIGMGESVLMMEKFSGKTLAPWEKQPPHNYFIITAAELGLPASIFLLWFFLNHLWQLIKKIKSEAASPLVTVHWPLFTILISFLLLMQFDHYFYDIEQTKILLWIFLALISSQIKNPQTGDSPTSY